MKEKSKEKSEILPPIKEKEKETVPAGDGEKGLNFTKTSYLKDRMIYVFPGLPTIFHHSLLFAGKMNRRGNTAPQAAPAVKIIREREVKGSTDPYFFTTRASEPEEKPIEKPKEKKPEKYSEKATAFEMLLAGKWFAIAGVLLIMGGAVFLLRSNPTVMGSGFPQVISGFLLSIALIFFGDRFHRKDMKNLGHSLISAGFCILLFTVSSANYNFHIINPPAMVLMLFSVILASGFTIFYYDSKIIASVVLLIAFLTPFIIKSRFDDLTSLYSFLIAINLGVVVVAIYKKWDFYIMISFLFSYFHFFANYGLAKGNSSSSLVFLTVFYLLFLAANNLFHFKKKVAGGYNLFVSYFNPLLYGCVSYYVLKGQPNWIAFLIYAVLGIIHLFIVNKSRFLEEFAPKFADITRTNLVLGLMFITSAVSFVTYFNINDDRYFGLVTLLWFIEAFVLLIMSIRMGFCDRIMRRFSYLNLVIIWAQLISVVSWMPDFPLVVKRGLGNESDLVQMFAVYHKFAIYFISMLLFYIYFRIMYHHRDVMETEDNWMMGASLLSVFGVVAYLTYGFYNAWTLAVLISILGYIILYSSFKYSDKLAALRYAGYGVAALSSGWVVILELFGVDVNPVFFESAAVEKTMICFGLIMINALYLYTLMKYEDQIPIKDSWFHGLTLVMPGFLLYAISMAVLPARILTVPLVLSIYAFLLLALCLKYYTRLGIFRYVSYMIFCIIPVMLFAREVFLPFFVPNLDSSVMFYKIISALGISVFYMLSFAVLDKERLKIPHEENFIYGLLLVSPLSLIINLMLRRMNPAYITLTGAFLANLLLVARVKFPIRLKDLEKVYFLAIGLITLAFVLRFETIPKPAFFNGVFVSILGTAFLFFNGWYYIRKNEDRIIEKGTRYHLIIFSLIAIFLMKGVLTQNTGLLTTFLWSLIGLGLLRIAVDWVKEKGLVTAGHIVLFVTMLKSLNYDASMVSLADNAIKIGNVYHLQAIFHSGALIGLIAGAYYYASKAVKFNPKLRDMLQLYGLIIIAFQSSAVLFRVYGVLDEFQVYLTVFWSAAALLSIILGIAVKRKIFRLSGILLLIASTLKVVLVDMFVLNFTFMAPYLLIVGGILVTTSFFYQQNKKSLLDTGSATTTTSLNQQPVGA